MTQEEVNKAHDAMEQMIGEAIGIYRRAVEEAGRARAETILRARKIYDDARQKNLHEQKERGSAIQ